MNKRIAIVFLIAFLASCTSSQSEEKHNVPLNEQEISEKEQETETKEGEGGEIITPPTPTKILVNSLSLKDSSLVLGISKNYTLKYDILPTNATNKTVSWTSSDDYVCRVDTKGNLIARHEGNARITVKTTDGSELNSYCDIEVSKIKVSNITPSVSSLTIKETETSNFSCSVLPNDATDKSIKVESLDESIATVEKNSANYVVKGIKEGATQIKISSLDGSEIIRFVDVTIERVNLESISLNRTKIYLNEESTFSLITSFVPSNASNKKVAYSSDNENVATIDENGVITAKNTGETLIKVVSEEKNITKTCKVFVEDKDKMIKSSLLYKQNDIYENYYVNIDSCPSYGDVNILVVPVWFTDSTSYISTSRKEAVRMDIKKSFSGSNEQTGWRSVKGYYEELSNGEMTLNTTISNWFECGESSFSYADETEGLNKTESLVNKAVSWYKKSEGLSSLEQFDSDKDGYLDGVVLIYGCPDYASWNKNSTAYTNLWAYTCWTDENPANISNPSVTAFMWASFDFMYGSEIISEKTGGKCSVGGGYTVNCLLDTHTYIHEFGHVLGLNDYYDYSSLYTAAGGFSMQDYNVGCHDPYSTMKLGWSDPYVVTDSKTITIKDFQSSRDLIMVTNNFSGSPFDEYFLIELYTPTGLNEFDSLHQYGGEESGRPCGNVKPGIRLWHVDGRLAYASRTGLDYIFTADKFTTNPFIENAKVCELMSNSFTGTRETVESLADYSELFLVRNDRNTTYTPLIDSCMFNEDALFYKGDSFNINMFNKQFKNSKKGVQESLLNNGEEFDFNITIESLTSNEATIKIQKY